MQANEAAKPQVSSLRAGITHAYRPDIDGLRAIAVLSVIGYHLGIQRLPGGFVGVDVFFVISGYLISSIILRDLDRSRFSIRTFYARRIRRIVPALFVVLLVTFGLAYRELLPTELADFGKSLMAATLSVSNIYFWITTNYFDAPASTKPLLHTWSLAVEEQFYLFFPLLLMAIHSRFKKRLPTAVVGLALISFLLSAWGVFKEDTSAFYLAHSRAWELLTGTLVALNLFPIVSSAAARNCMSLAGLGMIIGADIGFSPATPFPGVAALLPCVGTALVIAAGLTGTSLVSRILSFRPVVFIGLISYSLYLWHWPLIVFQHLSSSFFAASSVRLSKLILFVATLVLATLSWKFVEQPFRNVSSKIYALNPFRVVTVAFAITLALGASAVIEHGFPTRYSPSAVAVASYLDYHEDEEFRVGTCFITPKYTFSNFDRSLCLHQDAHRLNYLLFGDSHAAHLWRGLSAQLQGINLMQATGSGCYPTLDRLPSDTTNCADLMNFMFSDYLPAHHVDRVIMAARWYEDDLPALARTLQWTKARGIDLLLLGPMVQYDAPLPRLLADSIRLHDPDLPKRHLNADFAALDREMKQLASATWHVKYVSFFDLLCPNGACVEYAGPGVPLQFDYGHLTEQGSLFVSKRLCDAKFLP